MANRAYLMNHTHSTATTASASEEACLLGANNHVPILWVALFEPTDLTFVSVPCTNDNGDEFIEEIPTLFAATNKAKIIYSARRALLARALGKENACHFTEWDEFLTTQLTAPMLQLDLGELWMMYENQSDFELDIRDWLSGVSNPTGHGWEKLCSQAYLEDAEVRRYGIRGFPWQSTVPWV